VNRDEADAPPDAEELSVEAIAKQWSWAAELEPRASGPAVVMMGRRIQTPIAPAA
jgi:hypothetical protein